MESRGCEVDLGKFHIAYFPAFFISARIKLGMKLKARFGRGGTDEVHHNFEAFQRSAAPIPCDMTKEPVFDLVPLAGAGRKVADLDLQPRLVTQFLEGNLPKAIAPAMAAATVRRDQQPFRLPMAATPQPLPPTANRRHSEFRGVAAH